MIICKIELQVFKWKCLIIYVLFVALIHYFCIIMIDINFYLIISAALFCIGVAGVLIRRNAIIIFMCIELMLNAINLSLVAFSSFLGNINGQIFVFIVMTVAAAEAAVGLAIVISLFRNKESVNIDEINILKW